jgi:hypothetical protein
MASPSPVAKRNYPPEVRELFKLNGQGVDQDDWLRGAESSVEFLKANARHERVVIYASLRYVLISAVLAPLRNLKNPDQTELSRDFVRSEASWYIEHVSGGVRPNRVYLASPMDNEASTLKGGEKLAFRRSWAGAKVPPPEISQKLVHALDLHFVDERQAFCRIDEAGDIEDVIRLIDIPSDKWGESILVITIKAVELYEYARLAGMGLVFFYDFTRTSPNFMGWSNQQNFDHSEPHLFYHGAVQPGSGSYLNGRQIVIPPVTVRQIVRRYKERRNPKAKSYATFKAIDLKTGNRIEVSSNPKNLSNYFQEGSSLPLEMSPAFFNAEVLHRYKADPAKYDLEERSIRCRGAWSLRTYDVNDAGQVHTYLRYLGELPYREQVYWQSFNEWPKGPLSRRAVKTDFHGDFHTDYDPLLALKWKVNRLDKVHPDWWNPRGNELAQALHRPVTTSESEWADSILALDHLVTEGFAERSLKAMLTAIGRHFEKDWRSLKLLGEVLIGLGAEPDDSKAMIDAMRLVHDLRSIVKGHAAPAKKAAAATKAQRDYGSFRAHFEALAAGCDDALAFIMSHLKIAEK